MLSQSSSTTWSIATFWAIGFLVFAWGDQNGFAFVQSDAGQAEATEAQNVETRIGRRFLVPLPIDNEVSEKLERAISEFANQVPLAARRDQFPVVVLEFDTSEGKTGQGSKQESCQSLASFLSKPMFDRIETIAYVPAQRGDDYVDGTVVTELNGHAVLVAVCADQLILEKGASIGNAGIDLSEQDSVVTGIYRLLAEKRQRTLPPAVVVSMVDKSKHLFRVVDENQSVQFLENEELEALGAKAGTNQKTISSPGQMTVLTGEELVELGFSKSLPLSRKELAETLRLAPNSLTEDASDTREKKAVKLELPEFIDEGSVRWLVRSLRQQIASQGYNVVILEIDACDGDFNACVNLAQHLQEYDPNRVKTVAFIKQSAKGPAGVLALACQQVIMKADAKLGGKIGEEGFKLDPDNLEQYRRTLETLAFEKRVDWSPMMAMLNPDFFIHKYVHEDPAKRNRIRLLSDLELESVEDAGQWLKQDPIGFPEGLSGIEAKSLGLADRIRENMTELETLYGLTSAPRRLQPSKTDRWLEDVARFLSSPFIAPWLLFAGFFFFSTEMSAPGLGLPGFLATVCFVLFFWSQFLGGNADWFEVILFVLGGIFVAMEVFVLPGFGIFGVGGLVMIIVSLVLASQSFIVPMTNEEIAQIPYSLMPVLGAGFGVITAAFALRKIIPNSPYLRRLMLVPKKREDTGLRGADPEAVVDWSHLNGKTGTTTTRLFPAGKARIAGKVYDVISRGQMIDKGQEVVVVEAIGNRVVVIAADQHDE